MAGPAQDATPGFTEGPEKPSYSFSWNVAPRRAFPPYCVKEAQQPCSCLRRAWGTPGRATSVFRVRTPEWGWPGGGLAEDPLPLQTKRVLLSIYPQRGLLGSWSYLSIFEIFPGVGKSSLRALCDHLPSKPAPCLLHPRILDAGTESTEDSWGSGQEPPLPRAALATTAGQLDLELSHPPGRRRGARPEAGRNPLSCP